MNDLKFAFRRLMNPALSQCGQVSSPTPMQKVLGGFTVHPPQCCYGGRAVTVLALALGIGANTAIFGVLNDLLFHPVLVKNPDSLTALVLAAGRPRIPVRPCSSRAFPNRSSKVWTRVGKGLRRTSHSDRELLVP